MDIRASDRIPGAKVRYKRAPEPPDSSVGKPREWLALADGAVQEARTEGGGSDMTLLGRPVPYQPGRAEVRSGIPTEVITSDHVPNNCTCSWGFSRGKLTLKHYNASCRIHRPKVNRGSD